MSDSTNIPGWKRHVARVTALAIVVVLYGFARLPHLTPTERAELASHFRFTASVLPAVEGPPMRTVRSVQPSLDRISAWISSVGASVALNDVDGDGLPNDVCYVDVRTDQVIVAPVPGTPQRYAPFTLDPAPLPYDADTMAPMGCLPADMNEDGLLDILVYYWGRTPVAFMNRGAASLSSDGYVPGEIMPEQQRWFTNAATTADLDGDGHVDLIIGNYFQDGAHILDEHAPGTEEMQHSMSRAANGGYDRILRWTSATSGDRPTVTYEEAAGALDSVVARGWTLAAGAADLDGDLLPEIYFANDFGPDRLLHNESSPGSIKLSLLEGTRTLTTPKSKVLGHDSFKGMGVDFADVNGDGWLDIYVSNIAHNYALHESHFLFVSTGDVARMRDGVAPYVDRSEPLGLSRSDWGWESRLDDFDNDGVLEAVQATGFVNGTHDRWPELQELATGNDELLSDPVVWPRVQEGDDLSGHTHNRFFARAPGGRYFDVAEDVGLGDPWITRGIATADVDGDGDLDMAVANQWEDSYFYRNDAPAPGRFMGLHLRLSTREEVPAQVQVSDGHPQPGDRSRPAIGAAATVHLPDGRQLVGQVDGGNGHSGARSFDLHFGLGQIDTATPLDVDVRWRDAAGTIHRSTVQLVPGWHTVLLY